MVGLRNQCMCVVRLSLHWKLKVLLQGRLLHLRVIRLHIICLAAQLVGCEIWLIAPSYSLRDKDSARVRDQVLPLTTRSSTATSIYKVWFKYWNRGTNPGYKGPPGTASHSLPCSLSPTARFALVSVPSCPVSVSFVGFVSRQPLPLVNGFPAR